MRNDKIFRKQSVLQGCYSAQPGSRIMTPFERKGDWPHKICISGLEVGWAGVLGVGRAGPTEPGHLAPTLGLLPQTSQQLALGPRTGRMQTGGVLAMPSQLQGTRWVRE